MPRITTCHAPGRRRALLAAAALAAGLALPAGGALGAAFIAVVPDEAVASDGNADNTIPFGASSRCENGFRYQQVLEGDRVGGGRINSIAFRLDADEPDDFGPFTYGGTKVRLSSTDAAPGTLSDEFDANLGPDATLVFSGDMTAEATTGDSPNAFEFEVPVEAPFEFGGAGDNLLIDVTVSDCPAGASAFFDADNRGMGRAYAWDKDRATAEFVSDLGLVTELFLSTPGLVAPLYDCPLGDGGDGLHRGFYLEDFPAERLDEVTLNYRSSTPGVYAVRVTAREGAYDGRMIGGPKIRTFSIGGGSDNTDVTFDFGGATVTEGEVVTFTQEVLAQPADSSLFYDTGDGDCDDIVQTNGTSPPLDVERRQRVAVTVMPSTRMRGVGGNWTVVGHDGEGFMIDVTDVGQLVAIWFTYNEVGEQMWLIGVDPDFDGTDASMSLERLTGPSFGPDFNVGDRVDEPWGTLTITFEDCNNGRVTFNSTTGFGAEEYDITRVYRTEQGVCP